MSLSVCVCVCVDVNHGGTNPERYTQRLVILRAQTFWWTLMAQQNQFSATATLLEKIQKCQKVGVNWHFQASWASRPWAACCNYIVFIPLYEICVLMPTYLLFEITELRVSHQRSANIGTQDSSPMSASSSLEGQ